MYETYIPNSPFYYQVGSIFTRLPWARPSYERVQGFFRHDEVMPILKKYSADICGSCLWDMEKTWDLDLSFYLDTLNLYGWNEVESDINKINDVALNQFNILVDVTIRQTPLWLPTKQDIIEYRESGEEKIKTSGEWIVKIGYVKKVIHDKLFEYDMSKILEIRKTKLTEGFLYLTTPEYHQEKIIDRILQSKKDVLAINLSYASFLSMSKEEFEKTLNF